MVYLDTSAARPLTLSLLPHHKTDHECKQHPPERALHFIPHENAQLFELLPPSVKCEQ